MMEYFYPTIKKNEIVSFVGKWMELEIMLNEISHSGKDKYHVFSPMWNLGSRGNGQKCKRRTIREMKGE
jgi:hypothetical protein